MAHLIIITRCINKKKLLPSETNNKIHKTQVADDLNVCKRYGFTLQKIWFCLVKDKVSPCKRYGFAL